MIGSAPIAGIPIAGSPVSGASSPPANNHRQLSLPFKTTVSRSRRLQRVPDVLVASVAPPPVTTYLEAAQAIKRRETARQLRLPLPAPVFPATAAQPLQFSATVPHRPKRRKGRAGLFLSSGDVIHAPTPASTASAPEPAFRARQLPLFAFDRKLQKAPGPLHVGAATTPTNNHRAVEAPFRTRVSRSRRLQSAPPVLHVAATTPTAQPYLEAPQATRRRGLGRQLQLLPLHVVFPQAQPVETPETAHIPVRSLARRHTRRKLLPDAPLLEFPQTPPVPPQPAPAWRLAQAFRAAGLSRQLQEAAPQLEYPVTPVVPPSLADEWIIRARRRGRR